VAVNPGPGRTGAKRGDAVATVLEEEAGAIAIVAREVRAEKDAIGAAGPAGVSAETAEETGTGGADATRTVGRVTVRSGTKLRRLESLPW